MQSKRPSDRTRWRFERDSWWLVPSTFGWLGRRKKLDASGRDQGIRQLTSAISEEDNVAGRRKEELSGEIYGDGDYCSSSWMCLGGEGATDKQGISAGWEVLGEGGGVTSAQKKLQVELFDSATRRHRLEQTFLKAPV